MNRKYYSFETGFTSLQKVLEYFLKIYDIYYEVSQVEGNFKHYEILCNVCEKKKVEDFIYLRSFVEE